MRLIRFKNISLVFTHPVGRHTNPHETAASLAQLERRAPYLIVPHAKIYTKHFEAHA
jgi:hypothetical protein